MPEYSDIDPKAWRNYPEILTDSLWLFDKRDSSWKHDLSYPGQFIPQIASQVIQRYSKKGEIVLDLFLGGGTTAIEAVRQGRRCVGVDLNPEALDVTGQALDDEAAVLLFWGDSSEQETRNRIRTGMRAIWQEEFVDLLILHPPYHNIIQFTDEFEDLSNQPDTERFLNQFARAVANGKDLLKPGRFAVLVVGDAYQNSQWVPLGFYCMQKMMYQGFILKSICVKNMAGNEGGSGGKNKNLWRYRCLAGGYYRFAHEYIMILQKPE